MRVLVTGATGTVGSVVTDRLVETDHTVVVASRDPIAARARFPDADEAVRFDFTDQATYREAFAGVDALFLVRPPELTRVERDVIPAVHAAVGAGVERVVFLSVLGAEKNPLLPHRRIERALERSGLAWTSLRASFFMQNFTEVHGPEIRAGRLALPAGTGTTSFVDARDVADVAVAALTEPDHEGRAYDLTGPEALECGAVARIISTELDHRVRYDPTYRGFLRESRRQDRPLVFTLLLSVLYTIARVGLAGRVSDDTRRVLDREPRDLRAFVADHGDVLSPSESVPAPA